MSNEPLKNKPSKGEITAVSGDLKDILAQAKQKTDKNIWIGGGAHVAQEFLNEELVDELSITVVPVVLGDGIRLFQNIKAGIKLRHDSTKTYEKGLVQLSYSISAK